MNIPACEIMSTRLTTVSPDASVEDLLKLFVAQKITGVPVCDANGKMVGVYSEYDLIRQVGAANRLDPKVMRQKIQFTEQVEVANVDEPLEQLVKRFIGKKYRRLPVMDASGTLVGIITRRDLMRVFFFQAKLADQELV